MHRSIPWISALWIFALLAGACGPPAACERLARSFCAASSVSCDDTRALFTRAELTGAQCEEADQTLQSVLAAVSPDVRGLALTMLLLEVLSKSPKIPAGEVEAMRQRLGIPAPSEAGSDPGGGPPVPVGIEPVENRFVGYMEVVDEPTDEAAKDPAAKGEAAKDEAAKDPAAASGP